MSKPEIRCNKPLPDGSPCHACRVYEALVDAEYVVEPETVDAGMLNIERCLAGLGDGTANFLCDLDDDDARAWLIRVFMLSRRYRAQEQQRDALAYPVGNA